MQEMVEWDEANPDGTVPEQECEWSMVYDKSGGSLS